MSGWIQAALQQNTKERYQKITKSPLLAVKAVLLLTLLCKNCIFLISIYIFSDFNQDKPPTTCAFDEITGEDKFCCQDLGPDRQRVSGPQAPQFSSYPCIDHTSHCSRWVKNEPKSCSPEHKSYPFMRESCQKTCGRCGDKVKVSQI